MSEPITIKFVCASKEESVKIATSIAEYLKSPVVIEHMDGTKNHVVALEAGTYDTVAEAAARNTDGNDPAPVGMSPLLAAPYGDGGTVLRRGPPNHAEDDMPPQSIYSDFDY